MDELFEMLIRRRDQMIIGSHDSALRRGVDRGTLVRVGTGVYAPSESWSRLDPLDRHRARVIGAAERLRSPRVFSHFAAAAIWGIRIRGEWPEKVDVTVGRTSGGRSDGALRRHCVDLDDAHVTSVGGLLVTTPARTVIDLARTLPFVDSVVAMDSALHRRRKPAPLVLLHEIFTTLSELEGRRGWHRALEAAEFATPLSDSPPESESRVLIHQLGFPAPVLQKVFPLDGRDAEVDFWWQDFSHVGECDGRAKYVDPALMGGRTAAQVLFDEKARENEIRRQVRMFSRWEPSELRHPQRLWERLTRDGLPSSRTRYVLPPR